MMTAGINSSINSFNYDKISSKNLCSKTTSAFKAQKKIGLAFFRRRYFWAHVFSFEYFPFEYLFIKRIED